MKRIRSTATSFTATSDRGELYIQQVGDELCFDAGEQFALAADDIPELTKWLLGWRTRNSSGDPPS